MKPNFTSDFKPGQAMRLRTRVVQRLEGFAEPKICGNAGDQLSVLEVREDGAYPITVVRAGHPNSEAFGVIPDEIEPWTEPEKESEKPSEDQ